MKSLRKSSITPLQKQPGEVFHKEAVLKSFAIFSHRKTPVLESLFNKVADL